MSIFTVHLVLLLGHHVDDGVDDDSGPVDNVGDDVDVRVFVALIKLAIIKVSNESCSPEEFFFTILISRDGR